MTTRRRTPPPIIDTPWGPVTESARLRAAMNMRRDPALRALIEEMVIREHGRGIAAGLAECRRRYPESYK